MPTFDNTPHSCLTDPTVRSLISDLQHQRDTAREDAHVGWSMYTRAVVAIWRLLTTLDRRETDGFADFVAEIPAPPADWEIARFWDPDLVFPPRPYRKGEYPDDTFGGERE